MEKEQMASKPKQPAQVNRIFEQPADAISLYSDFAQIVGTGQEVLLQFYESIPGVPAPGGTVEIVRTRLRATITVSKSHAANIGRSLLEQSQRQPPAPPQEERR